MAKAKTGFFCQSCGYESAKWMGQCPGCKQWNTMVEETVKPAAKAAPAPKKIYTIEGFHQLSGSISKYGITMDIEVRRGYVNGTYYYHSQGSSNRMTVSGTISGNTMSLEEYAPSGENTGYFEGVFNGLSYNGTFHNYSKGSTLNFSLTDR